MDIPGFLSKYAPFDALGEERLAEVVRRTHIEFFPAGQVILQQSGEPARFLYVVRTGAVELVDEGQVLDLLGEGEVFGHPSMLSGTGPTFTVRAHEDSLCYLIDHEVAEGILATQSGLAFLSLSLRRRVVRALGGVDPEEVDTAMTPVGLLVRRPPVTCPPALTVRDAAALMSRERVSSLLIEEPSGWRIVTDRDMRQRVIEMGRSMDTTLAEVSSGPLITVGADSIVAEVVSLMLERGIHHVPVTDDRGAILGMVTDTDLMALEQKAPFQLRSAIERATDAEAAAEAARGLPETVSALVEANVDPIAIGHVVAVAIDSLTRRLIEIGIGRQGDPPCPWAWLALGSEARQEQALLTDQDNALAYDPGEMPVEAVDPYFERLGAFVNDHIASAGIPKCRAGVNAENREWRGAVPEWVSRFRRWMSQGGEAGTAFTSIVFDYRQVAGPLDVEPELDATIRKAPGEHMFISGLARVAIDAAPPKGFIKRAVVEAKGKKVPTLDVKHGGIMLITSIARFHSVASGLTENRTPRRLADAVATGRLREEVRAGLDEAFRLLWEIRLEHQTRQVREGIPPDDMVDPAHLGPLARQGLREAFRMIETSQHELAADLGLRTRR